MVVPTVFKHTAETTRQLRLYVTLAGLRLGLTFLSHISLRVMWAAT